jgi:hypothetical protein
MTATVINKTNVNKAEKLSEKNPESFNCWGATLFILGLIEKPYWVSGLDMLEFLSNNTIEIQESELREGDIVALYAPPDCFTPDDNLNDDTGLYLSHTAVYIESNNYWHKKGSNEFTQDLINDIIDTYYETEKIKYFRLVKD